MANSKKLAELRNLLQSVVLDLERKGPTSSPKIVIAFREQHPELIRRIASDLIDIALTKFVSDVSRRTRTLSANTQDDLFKDFPGIPQSIAIPGMLDDRGALQRKLFSKATIEDVKTWLSADTSKRLRKRQRHPGVATLINSIEPFAESGKTIIEDAIKAWEKSKRSGT